MSANPITKKNKNRICCHRCDGPMMLEKFYSENDSFYGWHCLICGAILDPVILLHYLSQDAKLAIPETEKEILLLVKKYLNRSSRKIDTQQGQKGGKADRDLSPKH
jgi:hypothetical protein